MTLNITIGLSPQLEAWLKANSLEPSTVLARIESKLDAAQERQTNQMSQIDERIATLTSQVASNTSVIGSATTLINGFAAQLDKAVTAAKEAGATDQQLESLNTLGQTLAASDAELAAAVAANTPSSV